MCFFSLFKTVKFEKSISCVKYLHFSQATVQQVHLNTGETKIPKNDLISEVHSEDSNRLDSPRNIDDGYEQHDDEIYRAQIPNAS